MEEKYNLMDPWPADTCVIGHVVCWFLMFASELTFGWPSWLLGRLVDYLSLCPISDSWRKIKAEKLSVISTNFHRLWRFRPQLATINNIEFYLVFKVYMIVDILWLVKRWEEGEQYSLSPNKNIPYKWHHLSFFFCSLESHGYVSI